MAENGTGERLITPGIHHITAIASDPQPNLDFYEGILGLRFVKRTVNFDDPGTYHFYYGDEVGHPGTILTFFPWPGAAHGRQGTGQIVTISFAVPPRALDYWRRHLANHEIAFEQAETRFDERALRLTDPDGMALELVESAAAEARQPWADGPVPAESAIRGFGGVTLALRLTGPTIRVIAEGLGMREVASEGNRTRFAVGEGLAQAHVDLLHRPDGPSGQQAAGTVHHIAWRARDEAEQLAWRERLIDLGLRVTEVLDRQYFRSIYFREPGGVLFEIATDQPGFAIDEPVATLGHELKLPPWLEPARGQIEDVLPPIALPRLQTAR